MRTAVAALLVAGFGLTFSTPASAAPASAEECIGNAGGSGSVCLTVKGTGLHVDSVSTTLVKNHADNCGYATITFGSTYLVQYARQCQARTFSEGPDPVEMNFAHGTKVCVTWSNFPANKPCVTIKR